MPDFLTILSRWWKAILALAVAVTAIAAVILLLQPKQYLSVVTALPASNVAADKGGVFGTNLAALYPSVGTPDDLDRLLGTAQLDTLYLALAREKGLVAHYGLKKDRSLLKAAKRLKKHTEVQRSEYGELKIKVWDKDPQLAADLANSFLQQLQALHQSLQNQGNALVLRQLKAAYAALQPGNAGAGDTARGAEASTTAGNRAVRGQLAEYERLIGEYQLMVDTNPQVLLVVEPARPAPYYDRPKTAQTLVVVAFAALSFGVLLALFLQSRSRI